MFSVDLYGCETQSLILRSEHRLQVSKNWMLRKILAPKTERKVGGWQKKNCTMRSFTICTTH
jgi:hypothetical protein